MNELEKLANELRNFIYSRGGKVSCNDLLKWCEEHEIGLVTLQTVIQELYKKGIIRKSSKKRSFEVIPLVTVDIPEEIWLSSLTQSSTFKKGSERRSPRSTKKVSRRGIHSILEFVKPEQVIRKKEKKIEVKEEKREERTIIELRKHKPEKKEIKKKDKTTLLVKTTKPLVEKTKVKEERKEKVKPTILLEKPTKKQETIEVVKASKRAEREEGVSDEDLEKAIRYLNTYWSVGEIRFMLDLKALGIKNPEAVLRKLLRLGYVERSPLGVINATKKLPKISKETTIAELFFS